MTGTTRFPENILDRLQSAPYGAYAIDLSQKVVFWNRQAEMILGYSSKEVLGRKCFEAAPVLALDGSTALCSENCPAIVAAQRGRIPPVVSARMLCASGQRKHVTMFPLISMNDDQPILIHMFQEASAHELNIDEPVPLPLTSRELEILSLLALGIRPNEIATRLVISVHTVRKHISNASKKLHSHGMLSAVLSAQRHSLI